MDHCKAAMLLLLLLSSSNAEGTRVLRSCPHFVIVYLQPYLHMPGMKASKCFA